MDPNRHAALYTAAQALETNALKDVPNDRVAVVLGNGMVGTRYGDDMVRAQFQLMVHYPRKHPAFVNLPGPQQAEVIGGKYPSIQKDKLKLHP